jgi:HTH-type transcriptional regulator / antitoxin HigA
MTFSIIKTDQQYQEYCDLLHSLVQKEESIDSDEVEILTLLVEKWEKNTLEYQDLDPIQLLKEIMKDHNLNSRDLGSLLNLSKGTISKMLNYHKGLSKETIWKLSHHFKIDQSAFNKPYRILDSEKTIKTAV